VLRVTPREEPSDEKEREGAGVSLEGEPWTLCTWWATDSIDATESDQASAAAA
jgi:hypothetical protein